MHNLFECRWQGGDVARARCSKEKTSIANGSTGYRDVHLIGAAKGNKFPMVDVWRSVVTPEVRRVVGCTI